MKQDRFLLAVLLVIIGLAVLALVLFFVRGDQQAYGPEDTPQGVVRNYILAIQKGDLVRAYTYLASENNTPDSDHFQSDLLTQTRDGSRLSVQLGAVEQIGEKAVVFLTVLHPGNGPFSDVWREETNALLVRDISGAWKIVRMPYPYWGPSWYPDKTPSP